MKEIVDDDQLWEMKCDRYISRETLTIYYNEMGNYKNIYTFLLAKKPFYHVKDTVGNIFGFLETTDFSILSLFDFGIIYVDPRECSELSDLVNQPYTEVRSIETSRGNLLKMFTMGIREAIVIIDITECELSELECTSKILTKITDLSKKVGMRNINLLHVNYKTKQGISEMLALIGKAQTTTFSPDKNLRGFILNVEHQHIHDSKLNLTAKVGLTSGKFNEQPLRLIGNKEIILDSFSVTNLHDDAVATKTGGKIMRIHMTARHNVPLKIGENLCLIDETQIPPRVNSFTCQTISLSTEFRKGDMFLCVGCSYKVIAKVRTLVSSIDKRTGRVTQDNPEKIGVAEAAIVEFEILDDSYIMIAPFNSYPLNGRLCLYSLPTTISLEKISCSRWLIDVLEQCSPCLVAVCKSISNN